MEFAIEIDQTNRGIIHYYENNPVIIKPYTEIESKTIDDFFGCTKYTFMFSNKINYIKKDFEFTSILKTNNNFAKKAILNKLNELNIQYRSETLDKNILNIYIDKENSEKLYTILSIYGISL